LPLAHNTQVVACRKTTGRRTHPAAPAVRERTPDLLPVPRILDGKAPERPFEILRQTFATPSDEQS
jgi:hypothetical protein